ncbi:mediator of RNA polymerase II transcription subunit 12-like [Ylistrum balloti]|uniref:mediator of RNA polymerase II transcription subunit 12-like n=1 Tax=Ylistrum balloti TaxID=509963 RepID=UPI0029059059|nr:mediator of RNA polymerase II transcription subunit 12-like [Ylistrum balloti]
MSSIDERKIWKHWAYLKNELPADEIVDGMVEAGIFAPTQGRDILSVQPNTRQMKAEKFLNSLINAGDKGFETFCNIMRRDNENRYKAIMERLEIGENAGGCTGGGASASNVIHVRPTGSATPLDKIRPDSGMSGSQRPISSMSSSSASTDISMPSRDGETGEKNQRRGKSAARRAWRSESSASESFPPTNQVPPNNAIAPYGGLARAPSTGEAIITQSRNSDYDGRSDIASASGGHSSGGPGADSNSQGSSSEAPGVDMKALEQELVRIAPTIAELFQKFAKTTCKEPVSEEEIQNVKAENERLRKTNRALIEKLNSFQHRIIQLQLENKKLREEGEGVMEAKDELDRKEFELKDLEKRLEEQKQALEEKEMELNNQLMKIQDIENDIARQKEQIKKLETLHEEGQLDNERQQEEILILREDKKKQQQQILKLEFKQRVGEERLQSLDARMRQLEQPKRNFRRSDPSKIKPRRPLGMFYN